MSLGRGLAAWYQHPGKTASGDIFDPNKLTAAHATLPFGTQLRVVNHRTKKSIVVEVNDRMTTRKSIRRKFAIDLSRESAKRLGIDGIAPVEILVLGTPPEAEGKLASVDP
jgi:rare lipoprotein A